MDSDMKASKQRKMLKAIQASKALKHSQAQAITNAQIKLRDDKIGIVNNYTFWQSLISHWQPFVNGQG